MDGDLGGVDIMSGKEEATDGKSFLFEKKKKKKGDMQVLLELKKKKKIESKERWKNGRLFIV
jgi:hypothetical protein